MPNYYFQENPICLMNSLIWLKALEKASNWTLSRDRFVKLFLGFHEKVKYCKYRNHTDKHSSIMKTSFTPHIA